MGLGLGLGSLNPFNAYHEPIPIPIIRRREYQLTVRQEPKQARMCGVGGKG